MSAASNYKFLHPTEEKYPFDIVARQIVRSLESRNYQFRDFAITFRYYGTGEARYCAVETIESESLDFRLIFNRQRESLSGDYFLPDPGLSTIMIPGKRLHWHTGYTSFDKFEYFEYIGGDDDWARDRTAFQADRGWDCRREPYPPWVYYGDTGNASGTYCYEDRIAPNFACSAYPEQYSEKRLLQPIFNGLTSWLETHVLAEINKEQEAGFPSRIPSRRTSVFPGNLPPIYVELGGGTAADLAHRLVSVDGCKPYERFGITTRSSITRITYAPGSTTGTIEYPDPIIASFDRPLDDWAHAFRRRIALITPKDGCDIFVADDVDYILAIRCFERDHITLTEDEREQVRMIRGARKVPISDYRHGEFAYPIVLIYRELSLDEVRLLP